MICEFYCDEKTQKVKLYLVFIKKLLHKNKPDFDFFSLITARSILSGTLFDDIHRRQRR